MTAGLKALAGSGPQAALAKLTADRFRGLLAGAFVTALLNSSTITLQMVRRVRTVVVTGGQQDLDALVSRDNQIDQLESSILIYLGSCRS